MSATDDTNAARRGSGSNDLLGLVERLRFLASGQDDAHSVALTEAAAEIERLRVTLANESRRVCGTENDCVLQPHCSHAQKCMRPEWDAKA
jgi:hypothetical protein